MTDSEDARPAVPWEQVAAGAAALAAQTRLADAAARFLALVESWGSPSTVLCAYRDASAAEGLRMVAELTSGAITAASERALVKLFADYPPGALTRPTLVRPTEETAAFKVRDTLVIPWAHTGGVSGFLVLRGLARPQPANLGDAVALLAQPLWPRLVGHLEVAKETGAGVEARLRDMGRLLGQLEAEWRGAAAAPAAADLEALRAERDAARADADAVKRAAEAAGQGRERAEAERDAARAEAGELRGRIESLQAERDGARAQAEEAKTAGEAAGKAREQAEADRDAARAEAGELRGRIESLQAERDGARAQAEEAKVAGEAAGKAREQAEAERDAARAEAETLRQRVDAAVAVPAVQEPDADSLRNELTQLRNRLETLQLETDVARSQTEEAHARAEAASGARQQVETERDEARNQAADLRSQLESVRRELEAAREQAGAQASPQPAPRPDGDGGSQDKRGEPLAAAFASLLQAIRRTPFLPPTVRVSVAEAEAALGPKTDTGPRRARVLLLDRDAPMLGNLARDLEQEGLDVLIAHQPDEVTLFLKTPDARGLTALVLDVLSLRPDQNVAELVRGWRHDLPKLALFLTFRAENANEAERAQRLPSTATAGYLPRPLQKAALLEAIAGLARRAVKR